ncbi:tRNA-intron lyase [uncultured Methanomethylovorans sp.]|uniref:tRNA-intron lyase n=1 Tax=uncultured Methanomethylovorans sp. TaxID=183759 RepID=UPI002AA77887|nr:tRNA-intron lyase [uncultured Methanomethylovorans sp.]
MIGILVNDRVKAGKQAINELYNVGYYGRPKGDTLELTLIEAAYLHYKKKLEIQIEDKSLSFENFFTEASKRQQYFDLKYIVYKDLRERGYYVQPSVTDFRVYPRGGHPGKTPAKFFVHVISERIPLSLRELRMSLEAAHNVHKTMVLAIVDEESDITFYEIRKVDPKGDVKLIEDAVQGIYGRSTFLEDRVVVWDSDVSSSLHAEGFYGHPLDADRLQLSLVESGYLLKKGILEVADMSGTSFALAFDEFAAKASVIESEFMLKYFAYEDLRDRGLVPKTGFKFGSHFRVYLNFKSVDKLPHSEYLVHSISEDYEFALPVMSRAVRLANSVRKRMIYAVHDNVQCTYIDIGRIKM